MSLYIVDIHGELEGDYEIIKKYEEPTTKNDLGVDCIDRAELLKAMDTWDKFGYTARHGLERLDKDDKGFVAYVKYEDMVNCAKNMPPVTPQEPKIGYKVSGDLLGGLYCSECMTYVNEYFNYCPHCGAKMVKPQESEKA